VTHGKVGLVFCPAWTKALVIISEASTRLPWWAMFRYALVILDTLKPSRVALLDTYPVTTYITPHPTPVQDDRILYLSTTSPPSSLKSNSSPFSPPNLLQSTSASFLCILSTSHAPSQGTAIVVPSPYVPQPPPKVLSPSNFSHLSQDRFEWSKNVINTAQELLFSTINEPAPPKWEYMEGQEVLMVGKKRQSEVGEGGMYI